MHGQFRSRSQINVNAEEEQHIFFLYISEMLSPTNLEYYEQRDFYMMVSLDDIVDRTVIG